MTKDLDRRTLLRGLAAGAGLGALGGALMPRLAFAAAPGDQRFVFVILRGALDGLAAVPPIGDPSYAAQRGALALEDTLQLDGFFALHPALASFKALYDARALSIVHATAIPVRERSHFAAQAILEAGLGVNGGASGWLNRALPALGADQGSKAVAFSYAMPLSLTGPALATSYMPSGTPEAQGDYLQRVAALYASDPLLGPALSQGMEIDQMAQTAAHGGAEMGGAGQRGAAPLGSMAGVAAKLLADPSGPRVAVLEAYGWDTHIQQGAGEGQLARRLSQLSEAVETYRAQAGASWAKTVIVIATEFGRTVRPNGSGGTDHGTAGALFLTGGAVAGGRVIADWPGLKDGQLYENRDLRPTIDIRAVFKGVLAGHFGLSPAVLNDTVFPDSAAVPPLPDLVQA